MTRDEFFTKYGEEEVELQWYYKYTFRMTNDKGLSVDVGGGAEDIYRLEIEPNKKYKIKDLPVYSAGIDGKDIGNWFT